MSRIAVAGAGFAGLAAAEELHRRGHEVTVIEARARVGGRVCSTQFAGTAVELGAEFIGEEHTALRELAARLGLTLHRKGTPYGMREPRGGAPTTLEAMARGYEALQAAVAAGGADPRLQQAVLSLGLPDATAEAMLARFETTSTAPAGELSSAAVGSALSGVGPVETSTIDGGNQQLAHALARRLGKRVRLSTPVTAVEQLGAGVRVFTPGRMVEADALVLAIPPRPLGEIEFTPALPEPVAAAHARVRFGQAAKLFLPARRTSPPAAVLSVPGRFWSYTQVGADGEPTPVVSSFAGTPAGLDRLEVDRGFTRFAAQVRALVPELAAAGGPGLLFTWRDDRWTGGSYSAEGPGGELAAAELSRPVGRIVFAGEHTAGEWHATMEGAVRSGLRAAEQATAIVAQRS